MVPAAGAAGGAHGIRRAAARGSACAAGGRSVQRIHRLAGAAGRGSGSGLLERPVGRYEPAAALPKQQQADGYEARRLAWTLDAEQAARLQRTAKAQGVTLNTLLQTAWGLVLQRYSGQRDAVFGGVVSGRPSGLPGVEGMIGLFINTLPVRVTCSAGDTAADVLRRVQEEALASQAYAYYPLHEIQARCTSVRELIDHLLIFENYPVPARAETDGGTEEAGLEITGFEAEERTNYDLTVMIQPGEELRIHFDYNGRTYEEEAMRRLQGHWMGLLEQIAANPVLPVEELELLTAAERDVMLYGWNATALELPEQATLPALLQAQAERTPEAPAVVHGGAAWTYGQLHGRSNAIARWLGERGVKREERVGVLMSRTPQLIAGLLGILKAGGAYVPMDPSLPAERLEAMLRDAGIRVVLSETAQRGVLDGLREIPLREVLCLDAAEKASARFGVLPVEDGIRPPAAGLRETAAALEEAAEARNTADDLPSSNRELLWAAGAEQSSASALDFAAAEQSASGVLQADGSEVAQGSAMVYTCASALDAYSVEAVETDVRPEDSAYVMYTSGTTGTPKGVVVEHRNVVNFIAGMLRELPFGEGRSMLGITTVSFDIFVTESWVPLACGMKIVLAGEAEQEDAGLLAELLAQQPVQMMQTTPSRLQMLLGDGRSAAQLHPLDAVLVGGEPLPASLPRALGAYTEAAVYNMYGPTETTVWSTYDRVKAGERITIGRPIANTQVYVVNASLLPQPVGAAGELCIGGAGVAREYGARAELTAEKFVESPFVPGERMYRTGDLARWLPDGRLEHLGRIDHQVKIRGYRIELGEIEAKLLQAEGVREAVVTVLAAEGAEAAQELCAYVTGERELAASELRGRLAAVLPSYMIPSYFVQLAELTLTTSGKVDRRRLPRPDAASSAGAEKGYIAPRNAVEAQLADLWQEVLGVERVSIREDFFELGGHSLRAMTLISRIHQAMGAELPLRQLFLTPTVEGLAAAVEAAGAGTYEGLQPAPKQAYYPLTSAQKRLYVLQQLEGAELSYNMPAALKLTGRLDRTRLERALRAMIARHDVLRTSFAVVDGEPVQLVQEAVEFAVGYEEAEEHQAEERIRAFLQPFDLAEAPLLRAAVIRLAEEEHLLLVDLHHIVSDGASMSLFVEEFTQLYAGRTPDPLRLQYKDYAVWQSEFRRSDAYARQRAYWLGRFTDGELPVLNLPADHPRPPQRSFAGGLVEFRLDGKLAGAVRQLARESGVTVYMVLMAAYGVLLSRLSGQEDLIVGSPVAGRPHADLQPMLGMFVNTLALRTEPAADKTFAAYLEEVKQSALEAFEHGEYPFEELVEGVVRQRDLSRNPLFDAMFVLQNTEKAELALPGLELASYPLAYNTAKFDLTLSVTEQDEDMHCALEYASGLFEKATAERWAGHWTELLRQVTGNPQVTLGRAGLLTAKQRERLLAAPPATGAAASQASGTLHELFEAQAARTPEHTALECGGRSWTYRQLNERSNAIAWALRHHGAGTDRIVAVHCGRSLEMASALLGVLKSGAAYLPLSVEDPAERRNHLLADSGALLLLTDSVTEAPCPVVSLQDRELMDFVPENPEASAGPEHLAYVIYTSGTTGQPKGVLVEHRGIVHTLCWKTSTYGFEGGRALHASPYVFDAFLPHFFGPLLTGATIVLLRDEELKDPGILVNALVEREITHAQFTTGMFSALLELLPSRLPALRSVVVGGERITSALIDNMMKYDGVAWVSEYGPTENSVVSAALLLLHPGQAHGLGQPIGLTRAYVLSEQGELQPHGVPGELCLSGPGLARGYLGQPELTARKFIRHPFLPGERLYRTGDLVRLLADGSMEYIGRKDDQVKIRGHRIELGEIESRMREMDGVTEAVVQARADEQGHDQLCAYVIGTPSAFAGLRARLAAALPAYMVPAHFVKLERLPLTGSGKVDYRALPKPETAAGVPYASPRTPEEQAIAEVWQQVLGVERVGRDDHFFDLGGDSIKSIQVVSRLLQAGYQLDMKDLFRYPVAAQLSLRLARVSGGTAQGEVRGRLQLTPIQRWFIARELPDSHHFNQAVMLFRPERYHADALQQAAQQIAVHHDALRAVLQKTEDGEHILHIRGTGESELFRWEEHDLRGEREWESHVERRASELQRGLRLETGPLMALGLFRCEDGDHLLIAIHHLVIDGVSWRILFEDLAAAYGEAEQGSTAVLPLKTDSFQAWSRELAWYASTPAVERQREYWAGISAAAAATAPLPKDFSAENPTLETSSQVTLQWSREETRLLLKEAHRAYGTDINDLLLAALARAAGNWSGLGWMPVMLEGHGRESVVPGMDISRTVGWFTTSYPVLLEAGLDVTLAQHIKRVKENLRTIPDKGMGYGLLRYLAQPNPSEELVCEPEISFNYLGQFDEDLERSALQLSPLSAGEAVSGRHRRTAVLEFNGMVAGGELRLNLGYSREQYRRETVERLAQLLHESLREIISHCAAKERPELTPSDLLQPGFTQEELDALTERTSALGEIENVYALTPMQGMLFHSRLDPQAGAYVNQMHLTLRGRLDEEVLQRSWQTVIGRHAALRTSIDTGWRSQPLQVVFRRRALAVEYIDLRSMTPAEQQAEAASWMEADRLRGYDVESEMLMRVAVMETGGDTCHLLWSFHHIVMDGWCLPLVLQEVLTVYAALLRGEAPALPAAGAYSEYIAWLARQDGEAAADYWSGGWPGTSRRRRCRSSSGRRTAMRPVAWPGRWTRSKPRGCSGRRRRRRDAEHAAATAWVWCCSATADSATPCSAAWYRAGRPACPAWKA
nr:non-ribosomal peptide synthetase [Paenibacillus mucilaginosus]